MLLLLLQVQVVFACAMPEPTADATATTMADGQKMDCGTEKLSMSLKADCRDQQAVLPQAKFALELPQLTAPPRAEWPPILAPPAQLPVDYPHTEPLLPGSRTWLATLRLRI